LQRGSQVLQDADERERNPPRAGGEAQQR
jgi:hypothetical protein